MTAVGGGCNQYKHEAITRALIFLQGGVCKNTAIKVTSAPRQPLMSSAATAGGSVEEPVTELG